MKEKIKISINSSVFYYLICLLIIANVFIWTGYAKNRYELSSARDLSADYQEDIAIKTASMQRTSTTNLLRMDPFLDQMNELLDSGKVSGTAAFIAFDGDGMGKMNAKYGEGATNAHISGIGDLVRECFPESEYNITCNVGERSDEFYMFLSGRESEEALLKEIEAFQEKERNLATEYEGQLISGTISIGVAFYPEAGETLNELFEAADEAGYAAKEAGKDCTRVYGR